MKPQSQLFQKVQKKEHTIKASELPKLRAGRAELSIKDEHGQPWHIEQFQQLCNGTVKVRCRYHHDCQIRETFIFPESDILIVTERLK